jgi:transcriptional regulator with XRE-family HTH domain
VLLPSSPAFDVLHTLRRSGKSDTQIAREIGVSAPYIWRIRHGQRQPSPEVLFRLACVLGEFDVAKALAREAA